MTIEYWSIRRSRVVSTAGPATSGVPKGTTPTASLVDESEISIIFPVTKSLTDRTSRMMPPAIRKSATSMPRNWRTALPMTMNPKPKARAVSIAERTAPLRCEAVMSRVRAIRMGKFPMESMATKRGMKVKPSCRRISPILLP